MKPVSSHFGEMPHTKTGWWSVVLTVLFVMLFVLVTNDLLRFSGFVIMLIGIVGGFFTIAALTWKRERSWALWLMLIPGLFAILFALGEILVPH